MQIVLEQPQAQLEVRGTLAKLDMSAGKGMLLTDLQKPIFFRLDRPELFQRLSIGDRVTMQLDDDGRVLKVIETLPSEVHEPLPPPNRSLWTQRGPVEWIHGAKIRPMLGTLLKS